MTAHRLSAKYENASSNLATLDIDGVQNNDLVCVGINANTLTTITNTTSGISMTEAIPDWQENPISGHTVSFFWFIWTTGMATSLTFAIGATGRLSGAAEVTGDVDTADPFDVAPEEASIVNSDDNGAGGGSLSITGKTTTVDNSIAYILGFWDSGVNGTITTPSGWTLNQNTLHEQIHSARKVQTTAGATGNATISNTEPSSRAGFIYAVKNYSPGGGSSDLNEFMGVPIANVKKINGVAIASVKKVNGVANT